MKKKPAKTKSRAVKKKKGVKLGAKLGKRRNKGA